MKKRFLLLYALVITSTGLLQASSNPNLSRVYANQFTAEVGQTQLAGMNGSLNTTFGTVGNGSESINIQLPGGTGQAIQVLSDGTFLSVLSDPTNTVDSVVAKYNSEGTVEPTAVASPASGYGTNGIIALGSGVTTLNARTSILDAQGRLLVAGGLNSGTAGWISRIPTTAGYSGAATQFTTGTAWQYIAGLAIQTSGEIIAVGFNGTNAQIGRYTLSGALDTTFGANTPSSNGFTTLTTAHGLVANVTSGLVSVYVDANNNMYVAYCDSATNSYVARFTAAGLKDTSGTGGWPVAGYVAIPALNSATSGLYLAGDVNGKLIVGGQVSSNVVVTAIDPTTGALLAGFTTFNANTITSHTTDTFTITDLVTTSNGKILITGSDTTTAPVYSMSVIRLIGTSGLIDNTTNDATGAFNTNGYNFFNISPTSLTVSKINDVSLAPDGQLYTVGYQTDGGTTTPYVSVLYNDQYVTSVAQYPGSQEQGNLDQSFGSTGTETYSGVTSPCNGLYGSLLKQRAVASVEVTHGSVNHGDILVGMNGLTSANAFSNMMLTWLTQEGAVDTSAVNIPASGYLTLANTSSSNEFMTSMIEDGSGNIYVAGYTSSSSSTPVAPGNAAATAAILRSYSSFTSGSAAWSIPAETGSGYQGVGVSLQDNRTLLCVAQSATVGHISAYLSGTLDTTFGVSGYIQSTSYGLNMGPCYGLAVEVGASIYAAYVDSVSSQVALVKFVPNGSGLDDTFNTKAPITGIFSGVSPQNVRVGFTSTGNVLVAATDATHILIASYNPITGAQIWTQSITVTGATALNLTRLTGVSDGTILVTFYDVASDDTMLMARLTSAGALDTTFNSQGDTVLSSTLQPGVLSIKIGDKVADYNARVATTALIQSTAGANQGNIVLVGYESVTSSDATSMVMRVYGSAGTTEVLDYSLQDLTPGVFEVAYNLATSPVISAGAGNVIFTYPSTNANAGKLLIGIDNGTTSIIARVLESTMALDTFGTSNKYTVLGSLKGISHISIDANNNILIGGTNAGAGWAQVLNNAGVLVAAFNMPGTVVAVNNIYQQQSGRYIVAGSTSSAGILVAFQDVASGGAFQVDASFNPLSFGSAPTGSYLVGTTGLYSLAINANDTIAVAYVASNVVKLTEITADGSGLVFAAVTTGVAADTPSGSTAVAQLNIDGSGNIVVGASRNTGGTHQVQIQRFDSAGGTTTAFTGVGVTSGVQTISNLGTAGVTLTGLMETTTQQTVLVGYNTGGGNGPLFAARLIADGSLDTEWNTVPSGTDTAGVLTYAADSAVMMNSSSIAVDGTVLSIGSTNSAPLSSDPIVTKVYGDPLVTEISQNPLQAASGTLDTTIPGSTGGALALSGLVTGVPAKIYVYNSTVNSSPNGAMLVASVNGATVYITELNADLSLNSAHFGSSGVVTLTPNSGSAVSATVTNLYVANGTGDAAMPIYIAGYTTAGGGAKTPFAIQVASNGSGTPVTVSPVSTLQTTGCVHQSTNSRVLVSGYNGTSGAIVAYNSAMTAIDSSFGNAGYYTTSVATGIYAMTTDNYDRIYIAYANAGGTAIIVQRLLENGTAVDATFTASFPVTGSYPTTVTTQIRMAIDLTNSQLVVAAQNGTTSGNVLQVARFSYSGGTVAAGAISTITLAGKVLNIADLFIDSDQFIYVIGNNSTDSKAIVARIVNQSSTTIALDSTYAAAVSPAPAGVANLGIIGAMTTTTAGMLDQDGRVYLVGSNGSTNGYMARVFNNQYWTEISPAILQGQIGTIDLTLNPGNTGGIDLSVTATTSAAWNSALAGQCKAQAIIENPNNDGTSYVAFVGTAGENSGKLLVGQLNADMSPVTGFGGLTTGLTSPVAMSTVTSMTIDASGNIIVSGTNTSLQQVVLFNASGLRQAIFGAPSIASTLGTTVAQQESGRYIVGGYDGSANGLITAYKNTSAIVSPGASGTLASDLTFGPAANNGYYPTGVASQIDDLCIDSSDYIYFVYRDLSNHVTLGKLTANGSGLVNAQNSPTSFNSGAVIDTTIVGTQPARIAINNEGYILVACASSSGVQTALYTGSGTQINTTSTILPSTNTPVVTKLVGAGADFYGAAYNVAGTPVMTIFAINYANALDPNFGTGTVGSQTGYFTTSVQSATQINGLSVQADGKVVAVGYNGTSTPDPILIRGYGYPYVAQYAQAPDLIAAGQLDTTLWPTSGAFLLNDTTNPTFNSLITGHGVQRIYESGNGVMLFVADKNITSDTVVFSLNKDLTLNTAFNTNGYTELSTTFGGTTGLFVDYLGDIFVVGNNPLGVGDGATWARGLSATGGSIGFNTNTFMASVQAVSQQSSGRIIMAGLGSATIQGNTNGVVVGFNTTGTLDPVFGAVNMGSAHTITDIAIDANDNIMTVALNTNTVILQKITATGTANLLSGGTAISSATTGSNIKVVLDASGDIVVAAATSTGYIVRNYINNNTGSGSASGTNNASAAVAITVGSGSTILTNMYATSDGKVTLVGYDSSTGYAIVARLLSSGTGASGSGTLSLDPSFNTALTGLGTPQAGVIVASVGSMNQFNDAIIHADDRIMLGGSNSSSALPYMTRIFGDLYATYESQASAGYAGTLDTAFGSDTPPTGYYDLTTLNAALDNAKGEAILSLSDGGYYMVVDNGTNSLLMKTIANGSLDTTFNSGHVNYAAGIAQSNAPTGDASMMMDGSQRIVLVGTNGSGGWVQRYLSGSSGSIDTTFGASGVVSVGASTTATVAVEQTLARLVVAGINAAGKGALFAYTSLDPYTGTTGAVDTTFNSTSLTPGGFSTGVSRGIYNLIADQYDRLIFAVLNTAGTGIDLYRLTPTGELDVTFGSNGKAANVFTTNVGGISGNNVQDIRVALDSIGNIVVAAYTYSTGTTKDSISVVSYDNGVSTIAGHNGSVYTNSFAIANFAGNTNTGMSLASLVTTADGYVLVQGNDVNSSSGASPTWVARLVSTTPGVLGGTYQLDITFNPAAIGGLAGVFKYTAGGGTTSPYHVYNAMTVNAIGVLGVLGYEQTGASTYVPSLVQLYDDPYTTEEVQSPDSKPVGSNDLTLGVSPTSAGNLGIIFYGSSLADATYGQIARAIALQDDNNIVVAIDGGSTSGGTSNIFIDMFDNDGILNPNFGSSGQATVLTSYQNQYVKDMVTFTPMANVHKAILAGYVSDTTLGITGSLLLQYNLTTALLDSTFGGYDGNPSGVALGDAQKAFVVGQQSLGRVVVGGITQNNLGVLLGYTSSGKLDTSFGNDGYQSSNTGATGIYTHAIDSENRVLIAYNNAGTVVVSRFLSDGSALDASFGTSGSVTTNITGLQTGVNNNFKLVVDGSGNVIVAAVTGDGTTSATITVYSYVPAGTSTGATASFTGGTGFAGSASSLFTIGRLLVDVQGNVIIVAYDSDPTPNQIVVTRLTSALALDATFNTNGWISYAVDGGNTQMVTDALIHPDGRILVVGSEE